MDAGAGTSASALCSVTGLIGQPDAGRCVSTDCTIEGGVWGMLSPGAIQVPGAPVLTIERASAAAVVLSWPAPAPGWVLQESSTLASGSWLTIITPLTEVGGRVQSLQPTGSAKKFYRLAQSAGLPALSVQVTATNTLLVWTASSSNWILERYPASGPGAWTIVSAPAVVHDGQTQVILPIAAGNDFYRLEPAPTLSIACNATNAVIVAWPASATDWVLQQSGTLASNTWTTLTNTPVQVGASLQAILSTKPEGRFYRLSNIR